MIDLHAMQRVWMNALTDPDQSISVDAAVHGWRGGRQEVGKAFAVYVNNTRATVLNAMSITFARSKVGAGNAIFARAMVEMIRATPPTSGDLGEYGAGFPDFLLSAGAANDVVDLARCEWWMDRLQRTPRDVAWTVEQAAQTDPSLWPGLVLKLRRDAKPLAFDHNIAAMMNYSQDISRDGGIPQKTPQKYCYVFVSSDHTPILHEVSAHAYLLATLIESPSDFECATERALLVAQDFAPFDALLSLLSIGAIAMPTTEAAQ
jgi:Putative DNA-binding domain